MIVTQISVDLSGENRNEYVVAKQKDEDRVLQVQLLDNGRVYVLDDKTTARVFLVKPDHTEVNHDCTISNNRVEIELDANMLAMSGTATAEIVLTGEGGKPLTSAEFDIKIKGTLSTDRAESSDDFQSLKNALGKADKFESDLELKATKEELDIERRRIEKIIAPGKQVDGLATKRLTERITSTSKSADDGNTFSVSWKSTDGGDNATFLNGIADKNPCVLDCYVYGMSKQAGTWENTSHRATAEITINGDTVSVSASYTTRDPDMNQAKFGVLLGYEEENREIADIRNGSDGKVYASAGEAVREQTKEVPKMSKALKTSKVDTTAFSLGAVNVSTGEIEASATEAVSIGITRFNGAIVGCKNSNNGYQIKTTTYYRASGKITDKNESWSNPGTAMKFTNKNDTIFDRISIKRQDGGNITLADLPEEIYTNIPELLEYLNGKEVETELQDIETKLEGIENITDNVLTEANITDDIEKRVKWTDGEYIDLNGSVNKFDGYSRSNAIIVKGGMKIRYVAQGYEKNVAMISKLVNGVWKPVVISDSSDIKQYEYITDSDASFVFSCVTSSANEIIGIAIIDSMISSSADKVVSENNYEYGLSKKLDITWNNGSFVANSGAAVELSGYGISEKITLPSKTKIVFNAQGYEKNVAMISKYVGGKYIPLVVSDSNVIKNYEYVTTKKTDVVFSCGNPSKSSVSISLNVFDSISEFNSEIDSLNSDISLSLFSKFGVVGDSFASGEIYDEESKPRDVYSVSWGQILARKLGTQCVNFSEGGLTTKTWLKSSKGLTLLNSESEQDIYYLVLGINDIFQKGESYLGVIEDIENKSDTFYGNYGKIINAIKTHAPNAKMIMFTTAFTGDVADKFNDAIIKIANYFKIPYAAQLDDVFFNSDFYLKNQVSSHPISIVYSGMANAFERLIQKCVMDNIDYFKFMYVRG